jgi:hypothetical protein
MHALTNNFFNCVDGILRDKRNNSLNFHQKVFWNITTPRKVRVLRRKDIFMKIRERNIDGPHDDKIVIIISKRTIFLIIRMNAPK